jgi:uncharacterized protein
LVAKIYEHLKVKVLLADLGGVYAELGVPVEMVTHRIRSDGDERGMLVYDSKFRPMIQG